MNAGSLSARERLRSGPARGLGRANELAAEAAANAKTLRGLLAALDDEEDLVRARASNALKKLHRAQPEALQPFASRLLRQVQGCTPPEARWNLTVIVGQLRWTKRDRALAVASMLESLSSESAFQRVFSLQALADLSVEDEPLRERVRVFVERALGDPSAAVRARARKLSRSLARS